MSFDVVFFMFFLGPGSIYSIFMGFPLPKTLIKILAKSLDKNLGGRSGPLKGLIRGG